MKRFASCCTITLVLLAGPDARSGSRDVISGSGDIFHLRDLSRDDAVSFGLDSLGYHYQSFGIFGLDLWRWGGEFVVYSDAPEPSANDELRDLTGGTIVLHRWIYAAVTDPGLEALGGPGVPWGYRCPPGLLLILAAVELWLVAPRRRSPRLALSIGGGLVALAFALWWNGVGQVAAIPLLLGLYHAGVGWLAVRRGHADVNAGDPDPQAAASEPAVASTAEKRPPAPRRQRPPSVDASPFRMPPQPAPLVVEYPRAPISTTAVAQPATATKTEASTDEEPPKHLR